MDILSFLRWINHDVLAVPATLLFFGASIWLTIQSRAIQIRGFKRLFQILASGFQRKIERNTQGSVETISGFQAVCTAMATSIGTGSIIAPSLAIIAGGPGALFWLIIYLIFGSVTKFVETIFAMHTRERSGQHLQLVGGPMQYLKSVHPLLASWYGMIMLILYFFGFQLAQSNTLANVFAYEDIPHWAIGALLATLTFYTLSGGARKIGQLATKLVPAMFFLYITFACYILWCNGAMVSEALKLVLVCALKPSSLLGGLAGTGLFAAMQAGVYRGIFISEAGLGSSSIAHSMADTKKERDQALLALYSTIADIILSLISGLLALVTNLWMQDTLKATIIYEIFKTQTPGLGQYALLVSIALFVFTTVMGNGFNGMQIFATFSKFRFMKLYILLVSLVVFVGAILPVPLVWEMVDTLLALAAIPNILGLLYLSWKHPQMLR